MACWLGKAVGGTLGMPFEGHDGPLDLTFYRPVPTTMLPNDDLDLQVVWGCVLDQMAVPRVDRHVLAKAWLDHVEFPWDEYGVAVRNLKLGIKPPLSGAYDNYFINAMGAPIRSEIWACLAPGNPELAAAYAYEDACVDHADDGIWAEVFLAALESAAFVETDTDVLLDRSLAVLPADSKTRLAVEDTRRWFAKSGDWKAVRNQIVEFHGSDNFTYAPMNIAFTVLGWLASHGDFSEAICIAVNCGKDTDCTGATVGSLMGILDPNCIPQRWLDPIGSSLVLSPGIVGLHAPSSLDGFTDLILRLADRLSGEAPKVPDEDQSAERFGFDVIAKFVSEMPATIAAPSLDDGKPMHLPGCYVRMPASEWTGEVLLLRYEFTLDKAGSTRVMVNTRGEMAAWIDGKFAFGASASPMVPSLHRAPKDQMIVLNLEAGRHELIAAIRRPTTGDAELVTGVGDGPTAIWHPWAFLGGSPAK